jgi:DNA-binding PadR family transcriptional regulator
MQHEYLEHGHRHHGEHHHGEHELEGGRGWCKRGYAARRGGPFDYRDARHGGFRGEHAGRERGGERMFDAGDVRLVVLKLLSEQPSYGYQLIKTMEERLGGGYTPSAGVIYPTLTMLEEEGMASVAPSENNKKVYSLTPEGLAYLAENKQRIDELFERLDQTGRGFRRGRSPEIMRAFMDLRGAVAVRMHRERVTREQIRQIAEVINAATKAIDEL